MPASECVLIRKRTRGRHDEGRPPDSTLGTSPRPRRERLPTRRAPASAVLGGPRASAPVADRRAHGHSLTPRRLLLRSHPAYGARARYSRDLLSTLLEGASRAGRRCAAGSASFSSTPSTARLRRTARGSPHSRGVKPVCEQRVTRRPWVGKGALSYRHQAAD